MKYASSVRYGGQLIDASDCDYQDYKHLGLLCPNCKEAIFLQGESVRTVAEKVITVPAHFKHFAAKDPSQVKQCESRVARYDQREVERRATIARNQRLKILQQHFWKMFNFNPIVPPYDKALSSLVYTNKKFGGIPEDVTHNLLKSCFKSFRSGLIFNKALVLSRCKMWTDLALNSKLKFGNDASSSFILWVEDARSCIDRDMQVDICIEVIDFLLTKQSFSLFYRCFICSYVDYFAAKNTKNHLRYDPGTINIDDIKDLQGIGDSLIHLITSTPWAREFSRLQETQSTRQTIKMPAAKGS